MTTRNESKISTCLSLFVLAAFLLCTGTASAQVRTVIPDEDPGPTFYARIERQSVHTEIAPHTAQWAAIMFYRSPSCVPPDFNLLDLFHIPAAFGCSLTIDGFEIWRNGPPPIDFAPMMAMFRGTGDVPIWFVSWPELQAAAADDVLTITELMAMDSLIVGTADKFHETLHPTGGAINPRIVITAGGILSDGRTFQLQHSGGIGGVQTRINFR
jgi:hypothetical protein